MSRDQPFSYHSNEEKSHEDAVHYAETAHSPIRHLAYRDMPALFSKYLKGKEALDYGIGSGASLEFLIRHGFRAAGADVSREMIAEAEKALPGIKFHLIQNGVIPIAAETFDLVFSSFVLFEIGSEKDMVSYLSEARRVLKNEGVFIGITSSDATYKHDWLTYGVDYPENKQLKSGDLAKSFLYDVNIEFTDYFWTESDYKRFFKKAGLHLEEIRYPLGLAGEPYPWKDELKASPYAIYIAKKAMAV